MRFTKVSGTEAWDTRKIDSYGYQFREMVGLSCCCLSFGCIWASLARGTVHEDVPAIGPPMQEKGAGKEMIFEKD